MWVVDRSKIQDFTGRRAVAMKKRVAVLTEFLSFSVILFINPLSLPRKKLVVSRDRRIPLPGTRICLTFCHRGLDYDHSCTPPTLFISFRFCNSRSHSFNDKNYKRLFFLKITILSDYCSTSPSTREQEEHFRSLYTLTEL